MLLLFLLSIIKTNVLRRLVFNQKSSVNPVSECRGVSTNITHGGVGGRTEFVLSSIVCSILLNHSHLYLVVKPLE